MRRSCSLRSQHDSTDWQDDVGAPHRRDHSSGGVDAKESAGHAALRKGRVSIANQIYIVTAAARDRVPRFRDFCAACAAARHFESPAVLKHSRMLAWVLMPDHAHWLIQLGDETLPALVGRLKAGSARVANAASRHAGTVWERAYHDRALRKEEDLVAAARYVIANPVRAGLVECVGQYAFWNAVHL